MPETSLCLNGKQPKIISFIDEDTQKYVSLKVKLSDGISEFELKKFFNRIYTAKLDQGYSNTFAPNYSTKNLNNCLKDILNEKSVINLEELYKIINKDDIEALSIFELIIEEFTDMFDVVECNEYSLDEYNEMLRQLTMNRIFQNQDSNFRKEVESIRFNSYFFNKQYQKEEKKLTTQQLVRRRAVG